MLFSVLPPKIFRHENTLVIPSGTIQAPPLAFPFVEIFTRRIFSPQIVKQSRALSVLKGRLLIYSLLLV